MKANTCFIFFLMFFQLCIGQLKQDAIVSDSKYLEDQFYVGLTYNLLLNKPDLVTQRNLSYGLQAGFIKDLPLNKKRNVALGLGVGYAVNSYYTNLVASLDNNRVSYNPLVDTDIILKRNKIETHAVEFPLEFRWRNSKPETYKFWRIYTGLKMAYVFGGRSKFVSENNKDSFSNPDIRNFQYGLTFNFGYNTFNIHMYYALSQIFKDGVSIQGGEAIISKPLRIGFIFYIL